MPTQNETINQQSTSTQEDVTSRLTITRIGVVILLFLLPIIAKIPISLTSTFIVKFAVGYIVYLLIISMIAADKYKKILIPIPIIFIIIGGIRQIIEVIPYNNISEKDFIAYYGFAIFATILAIISQKDKFKIFKSIKLERIGRKRKSRRHHKAEEED